jgi:hypothetical protein
MFCIKLLVLLGITLAAEVKGNPLNPGTDISGNFNTLN